MECPHCHAQIPTGFTTCPECGGVISDEAGRDEGVYAEIAQANLLRMRGDLRGAESQLLSLLKNYPNNATAHEMLGDVYFEEHEDGQAAQWYELALDLAPETPGLKNKLERAKERLVQDEELATVEHIGLGAPKGSNLWIGLAIGGVILVLGLLGIVAYLNRNSEPRVIRSEVQAPPQTTSEPSPTPISTTAPPSPTPTPTPTDVSQDQTAMATLLQHAADGARLLSLTTDPRRQSMQITFSLHTGENPRPIGARLARTALEQFPACMTVTVRANLQGSLVYVADAVRARLEEIQQPTWQQANPGEEAWQNYLLTNEWVANGADVPPVATPSGASSTSGMVSPSPSPGG